MTHATTADTADATPTYRNLVLEYSSSSPTPEPSPAMAPWASASPDRATPVKMSAGRPHSRPRSWDQNVTASGEVRRDAGPAKMLEIPQPTAASSARATLTLSYLHFLS